MSKATRETVLTLSYIVLGVAGAIAGGYLLTRGRLLHMPQLLKLYLSVSLCGTLVYASARVKGFGYVLVMLVLFYLVQVAMMPPPTRAASLMYAGLSAAPYGLALAGSTYLFKALSRVKFGRFLVTAVLLALAAVAAWFLITTKAGMVLAVSSLKQYAMIGGSMGAGLGLGLEVVDLLGSRPTPDTHEFA